MKKISTDKRYNYHDIITNTPEKLPNYNEKIKNFFEEHHLYDDEEIRDILDGSCQSYVRDNKEQWILKFLERSAMIVFLDGIYCRFTNLNEKRKKLFRDPCDNILVLVSLCLLNADDDTKLKKIRGD